MRAKLWPLNFWQRAWWQQWLRVSKSSQNLVILNARQIYIVPTRWGFLYAVMLIGLLIGSINYSLSLGFYVTFLLVSLGNIAMLHTWRNLVHLQISLLKVNPVFAGDITEITFNIRDIKNRPRYAIAAHFAKSNAINILANNQVVQNISAGDAQLFLIPLATTKRGLHSLPRLTLYTEFPLNLLHAWAIIENPFQILVYPKPSDWAESQTLLNDISLQGSNQLNKDDEDFNGHKNYQFGDSPSRIDWKASSRSIGLFTKLYSGTGSSALWLDWDLTKGEKEARISQLTREVIDAHASQKTYGLRLPNMALQPSNTELHYQQTLTALALLE